MIFDWNPGPHTETFTLELNDNLELITVTAATFNGREIPVHKCNIVYCHAYWKNDYQRMALAKKMKINITQEVKKDTSPE